MPESGQELPSLIVSPPGPRSQAWLRRHEHASAPMGPARSASAAARGLVLERGAGANAWDSDGNRYVDLAAGFGALLLGHAHPALTRTLGEQAARLCQALGDVYPSDVKIQLLERLAALYPEPAHVILAQSGADAVTAALKTAALATGRPGVIAFTSAYHGLSYGPLAVCGLRASYREPFAAQLNPHVHFAPYPSAEDELARTLDTVARALADGHCGAILVEPILGRGGVIVPPPAFLPRLSALAREHDALLVADEIWTGLGRSGQMLFSLGGTTPDLVCLGKGLGGGVPISALVGKASVMESWRREREVVHTATFAGAPLAAAAALTTLDVLADEGLVARARSLGAHFRARLAAAFAKSGVTASVRGEGLMIGIDLDGRPGTGAALQERLLARGYITSTGGGERDVLVLTPPLTIAETLLDAFAEAAAAVLSELERGS